MNRPAFREAFPGLSSAIGGEFGDSPAHDDESLARNYASDFPADERARYLEVLLSDAQRLMKDIDQHWEAMAKEANRRLYTKDDARDWLVRIMTAWQEELTRLRGGPTSKA